MTALSKPHRARRALLATTALVAAMAALPAYAQTQIAAPQGGGTITGAGTESVDDNTPAGGGIYLQTVAAPITFTGVTIANTTGAGPTVGQAANAVGLVNFSPSPQSILLNGSNSFSTTRAGGTAFRAQSLNSDLNLTINGGSQSFSGELGLHLRGGDAVSVANNGGPLIVSATGQYGVYSRANNTASTLNLGTVNITAASGTGIYGYGYTGSNVTTSGGSISAANGIAVYSDNGLASVVSGSTITGNGASGIGIAGYVQGPNSRIEITSNGAISNMDTGIYVENLSGLVGNIVRANADIHASSYGVNTGASTSTDIYVGVGATVRGDSAGIYRDSAGTTTNSGTIRGNTGVVDLVGGTLVNSGLVQSDSDFAINYYNGGTLTNQASGVITAATGNAVFRGGTAAFTLTNAGTINGGGSVAVTLNGNGTYPGEGGNTLNLLAGSTTNGDVSIGGSGVTNATIAGLLNGNYLGTDGIGINNITIAATGTVNNVRLGQAMDVVNYQGGTVSGTLDGGTGYDTLNLTGGTGSISIGAFEAISQQGGSTTLTGNFSGISSFGVAGGTLRLNSPSALTSAITLNGGTLRADTVGAFGTGQIQATTGTLQYGATGTYSNAIQLMLNSGAAVRLEADTGVIATLTGNITQQSGPGQSLVIGGLGTIALTGTGSWTGGTTIDSGATLVTRPLTVGGGAINNNGTLVFDNNAGVSINPAIGGTGNLVKRGADSLTIGGSNSYTGTTTIEAGTLTIASLATIASSSAVSLTGNTAVLNLGASVENAAINNLSGVIGSSVTLAGKSYRLANTANTLFAGNISAATPSDTSKRISKTGAGTLTLSGDLSSLLVGVAVNGGTLALGGGASLSNAQVLEVNSGATFDVSGITGTTSSVRDLSGSGAITLGTKTLSVTAGGFGSTFGGTMTGTGGFRLAGGTLNFASAMGYSGATTVSSGAQLTLGNSVTLLQSDVSVDGALAVIGIGSAIRSLSGGGALYLNGGNSLQITNGGSFTGGVYGGALRLTGGTLALDGYASLDTLTLDGGNAKIGPSGNSNYFGATNIVLTNGTLTVDRDNQTLSNITGAGNLVITGTTTLSNSSYTGTTTVESGTLSLTQGSALADTTAVTVQAPGTLELAYGSETIGSLNGAGDVSLGQYTLSVTDGGTYSGVMSGTGGLGIVGLIVEGGTLTLTGDNTYAGTTEVRNNGALVLGNGGTSGSLATDLIRVSPNATLTVNRSNSATINGLFGGGTFVQAGGGTTSLAGNNGFFGNVTISNGTLALVGGQAIEQASSLGLTASGATLDLSTATTQAHIGQFSGVAGTTVRYGDPGMRATLAVNTTFAGNFDDDSTAITAPEMQLRGTGTLTLTGVSNMRAVGIDGPTVALSGTGSLGAATALNLTSGSLNLSAITGASYALSDLSGTGGTIALGAKTLEITNGQSNTFAGGIQGTGGLHLTGGAIVLSSLNSYSGDTVIDEGTSIQLTGAGSIVNSKIVVNGGFDMFTTGLSSVSELAGDGTVVLRNNTLIIDGNGGESLFTGIIDELAGTTGNVTINSGHQTVSKGWTYSGVTTLNGSAALTIGDGGTNGSLAGAVMLNGGTLAANRSDAMTINGLFGTGTFTQTGTGTTTLGASTALAPAFTGNVIVADGGLTLDDWTALESASSVSLTGSNAVLNTGQNLEIVKINNLSGVAGSTINIRRDILEVNSTQDTTFAGVLHSFIDPSPFYTQGMVKSGSATLTLTGQNMLVTAIVSDGTLALFGTAELGDEAYVRMDGGTLDLSGLTTGTTAIGSLNGDSGTTVSLGDTTLRLNGDGYGGEYYGVIEGTGGLAVAGWQQLNGINTYSGNTVIEAGGTLVLSSEGSIANSAVTANGMFDLTNVWLPDSDGDGIDEVPNVTIANLSGSGSVSLSDGTLFLGSDNQSTSFSGTLSGGAGHVWKDGTGTWTLSGANDLASLEVFGGTVALAGTGSLGANAVVDLLGDLDISGLTDGGTSIVDLSGSGSVTLGDNTLTLTNGSSTYTGVMSGAGGVRVTGGVGTFNRTQLYIGTTTIDAGTTLYLVGFGGALTGSALVNGTLDVDLHAGDTQIGGLSGTGSVELGINTLTLNGGGTFSGGVHGSGGLIFAAGASSLSGANNYAGTTTIATGATLAIAGTGTTGTGAVVANGGFDISGAATDLSIANLSGTGTVALGAHTLTLGSDNQDSLFRGIASGTGGIAKTGSGVLTLSGANTYSGFTTVAGGTLRLGASGVLADDSRLEVLNGGTLDMNGFDETVASFTIEGNLIGSGMLTAAEYLFLGGTIDHDLGGGAIYQLNGTSLLKGSSAGSAVRVEGGTLVLGANERLADNAVITVLAGATLDLQTYDETVGSLALAGTLDGTGTLTASTHTLDAATVNANLGTGTLVQNSGTSLLNGTAATETVRVDGGTLRLGASDRLADAAAVTVATGAVLDLQGYDDTVGTLALAGTLSGTGTLTAATYTLDNALVNANLGTGTLIQRSGISTLNGTAATAVVNVDAGTLRLGASDRLADTSTITVATGMTLDLQGFNDTIGSLALAGTLSGTGTLTAATYTLDNALVDANLGSGTLIQHSGISILNGTAAAATVNVDAGTLRLGAANRLAGNATVAVATGTTLDLQGFNDSIGSLALAGTLSGTGTLTAATYTLDSALVNANLGTGALVQRSGTSTLNGTAAATTVNIDAGTLALGAANRLADTATVTVANGTTLDLQGYSDMVGALALAGTLSGTGTLTAATYTLDGATIAANLGTGTLVQNSGTSTLHGGFAGNAMQLNGGTLALDRASFESEEAREEA
ncbi:MAG: autotransporter-associated beta strand repeat-containing protein, partial [Pseudomonadota bacterium]